MRESVVKSASEDAVEFVAKAAQETRGRIKP